MQHLEHMDVDPNFVVEMGGLGNNLVVVDIGDTTTFMTLVQFAQLKYLVNKFFVKEVKKDD